MFYGEFDVDEDKEVIHQIFKRDDGLQFDAKLYSEKEDFVERCFDKIATFRNATRIMTNINEYLDNVPLEEE